MTRTRTAATAALAISSALVLAACGGGSSTDSGGSDLTGAVRVDGSSTVYPLTALAAEDFMAANPGVQVTV
ncbi:MAG: protein sphX, partial [Candidatus Nanopelagicales bacterium]